MKDAARTAPAPRDRDPSPAHDAAFAQAQRAFANGWIDVADLASVEKRVGRVALDVLFGLVVLAAAVNLTVWGTVALANGGFYFWPVWMPIPLGVVGGAWVATRRLLREDPPRP